jgi:hypothetical protein
MNADDIGHCLARNLFRSDLVVVDRCPWPGNECDLLVVTPRLQAIDVEIKISRGDLKADRVKEKWLEPWHWERHGWKHSADRAAVQWPQRVWKHYYAMPHTMWKPELAEFCNPQSGIITVAVVDQRVVPENRHLLEDRPPRVWAHTVIRRAKSNPSYEPISTPDLRKIAHLASCRMWSAYEDAWKAERKALVLSAKSA